MPNSPNRMRPGAAPPPPLSANKGVRGRKLPDVIATETAQSTVRTDPSAAIGNSPTGTAGGGLGGNYPNPDVRKLRETAGPTNLPIGAIATDGLILARVGGAIVGQTGAQTAQLIAGTAAFSGTVALAKLTAIGANGSVVFVNGIATAYTPPT